MNIDFSEAYNLKLNGVDVSSLSLNETSFYPYATNDRVWYEFDNNKTINEVLLITSDWIVAKSKWPDNTPYGPYYSFAWANVKTNTSGVHGFFTNDFLTDFSEFMLGPYYSAFWRAIDNTVYLLIYSCYKTTSSTYKFFWSVASPGKGTFYTWISSPLSTASVGTQPQVSYIGGQTDTLYCIDKYGDNIQCNTYRISDGVSETFNVALPSSVLIRQIGAAGDKTLVSWGFGDGTQRTQIKAISVTQKSFVYDYGDGFKVGYIRPNWEVFGESYGFFRYEKYLFCGPSMSPHSLYDTFTIDNNSSRIISIPHGEIGTPGQCTEFYVVREDLTQDQMDFIHRIYRFDALNNTYTLAIDQDESSRITDRYDKAILSSDKKHWWYSGKRIYDFVPLV